MEKGTSKLLEKMKHMKKNQWFILVLVGILILVIAMPVNPKTAEKEEVVSKETKTADTDMEILEKRLTQALERVSGVGRVEVMITKKSSGEKIVEKDTPVTDQSTKEEDSEGGSRSVEEHILGEETVYTQDGGGGQIPYVVEELEPEIAGVVVVAQGGDNSVVVQNITEAVMALFGVEPHKIKVMKMN